MDTEWFAVDLDGHVGHFDTGEDGALPSHAATGLGPADANIDDRALYGAILAAALENGADLDLEDLEPGDKWVVFTDSGADFAAAVAGGMLETLRAVGDSGAGDGDRRISAFRSTGVLSPADVEKLNATGPILGAIRTDLLWDALLESARGEAGIFVFHRDHGEDPGFYARGSTPERPLKAAELTGDLRTNVARVTLQTRFADGDVHLADHLEGPYEVWGDLPLRYDDDDDDDDGAGLASARVVGGQKNPALSVVLVLVAVLVLAYLLL